MWVGGIADRLRGQEGKRTLVAAMFFAGLTFAVFWGYLQGGNAIVGSDGMGPPADLAMMKEESSFFSSWRAFPALGHLNFPSPTLAIAYFVCMELIGLGPVATTQLMLVSSFWLAGFAMYLCTYRILGNYWAGLMAGFAYLFNQVFLSQVTEAHHYFLIGCALFPLLFLALYRALNDLDRRSAIILPPLALIFGTVAAPNLIMITSIFLAIFLTIFILTARGWSWARKGYSAMAGAITTGLLLLPTVLMKYSAGGTPVLATYYPIEQARLYSSYTMYHSFVQASSENTFIYSSDVHQWTFISDLWVLGLIVAAVMPITALFSLLVQQRRRLVISLLVPSAIFMVLATGTNPPFGELFTFMYKNVPLMDSIRVYSRLHLLTGFALAMLLGVVLSEMGAINEMLLNLRGRIGKALRFMFCDRRRLSALLAFCLVFPSSTVLTGEVRSFEIPSSYMAPYEWLGDQDGDFRVLNLPFQNVFYKCDLAHFDGYPCTMTMDVGMYSPTFSNKPYAFGLETNSYWTFIGSVIGDRQFGYRELSDLLGGTASVRYVVAQNYASDEERELFASMYNMTLSQTFPGGGSIYLNGQYQDRIHGLGALCLASGDRAVLPLIMGAGLVDLTSDGIVLIGDLEDSSSLDDLLELSQMIVIPNGDLLQMVSEVYPWDDEYSIDIASFGDKHSEDTDLSWILTNNDIYAGRTSLPTIMTTGDNSFSSTVNVPETGRYDLLIRTIYGPNAGELNITVDGETLISTVPWASYQKAQWVRVQDFQLVSGQHKMTVSNDGTGLLSLEQVILVPHNIVESRLTNLSHLLEQHKEKIVLLYSGTQAMQWQDGTYLQWNGEEGNGIANTYRLPITEMVNENNWVHDLEASSSMAVRIRSTGLTFTPELGNIEDGSTYPMEISLRYEGTLTGDNVATVVVQGRDDMTGNPILLGITVLESNGITDDYSDYKFNITIPEGVHQLEMNIVPGQGITSLYADQLSVRAPDSDFPRAYIEFPTSGTYLVQVKGLNATSDPYVAIDGMQYPLEGSNGTFSSNAINITAGTYPVEVGVSNIYSMEFVPTSLVLQRTDTTVSFLRISNTEYEASISTDQAGWVLLAESYSTLWKAEMDGQELMQVQVNSMVNAFYIQSAGNHTITFTFHGEEIYQGMLITLLTATVCSVAALVLVQRPKVRTILMRPRQERRSTKPTLYQRIWRKGGS